ncbi:MAG: cytochrome P450 [Gammaproteobacteria bacterium]|nr:cytochrome P450 [Gammaproteobacteria bacterium]
MTEQTAEQINQELMLLGELFTPEYIQNPYPTLKKVREYNPLFKPEGASWLASSYAIVQEVLRDKRFGHDYENRMKLQHGSDVFAKNAGYNLLGQSMLLKDPPDHKRIRGLAVKAFGAARINEMQPEIQAIVDELLDELEPKRHCDIISGFAFKLPVIVICQMLGIPRKDWPGFLEGSNISGRLIDPTPLSEEELVVENANVKESSSYFRELCERRRQNPKDDLITALVQAETEDGVLTEVEVTANIQLLFGAGHETTVNLIGNGLLALHRHPEQLQLLKSDPSLVTNAVEELLRYDSSVQFSGRTAFEDVEIHGRKISKGEEVMTLLGAANHDPEMYEDPDSLDIRREKIKPLSFGGGIHTCLGAQLARIEASVALNTLLKRLPGFKLDDIETPEWKDTITLRGLKQLRASW